MAEALADGMGLFVRTWVSKERLRVERRWRGGGGEEWRMLSFEMEMVLLEDEGLLFGDDSSS